MQLSSDSMVFYKLESVLGWRVQCDLSNFTHVSLIYLHIEPASPQVKKKICKVYCNIISRSLTDPLGTLTVIGSTNYQTKTKGIIVINPSVSY